MPNAALDSSPVVSEDLKNRIKDSYDAIAEHYNTNFTRDHDEIRLDFLGRFLKELNVKEKDKATVLELGCGGGIPGTQILLENQSPSIHVTANDLSSTQIDIARSNLATFSEKLTLVQGDMMQLSFPDESFDAVIGFYSVIHLPRDEQAKLVKKIVRWLKPGGLFLTNFLDKETSVAVEETWLDQEKGWMFWSGWGGKESAKMVEETGLNMLVTEIRQDLLDAAFMWVMGKKPNL
ncbi:S-adenosyl-L-methionine-dependent methyltransferase [Melanomma pulvis-pyrius CBS 109.77]|uniref:S-adenosyl-L-methionine-dependent methyltransferase n=1 Tax=Melanomma pulvis-pyrius CBS 109.77 TaxID=1314802 RepID=A0A6A6X8D8_9PLEO|nr:S-adenosyl-L-methionine-dependent methyltransferase [Melanomma pulvis-pyrius CBS 109.77]